MKKSILALEGIEILSNEKKKSIISGSSWGDTGLPDLGPEPPCGGSWSASLSEECRCKMSGLLWACGECFTSKRKSLQICHQF